MLGPAACARCRQRPGGLLGWRKGRRPPCGAARGSDRAAGPAGAGRVSARRSLLHPEWSGVRRPSVVAARRGRCGVRGWSAAGGASIVGRPADRKGALEIFLGHGGTRRGRAADILPCRGARPRCPGSPSGRGERFTRRRTPSPSRPGDARRSARRRRPAQPSASGCGSCARCARGGDPRRWPDRPRSRCGCRARC